MPLTQIVMKKDIHPDYNQIIFEDLTSGFRFLTRSTLTSDQTGKWDDGNEYPVIKVEISSSSHPFYTGEQMLVDTAGRVDRFKARLEKSQMIAKDKKPKKAKVKKSDEVDPVAEKTKAAASDKEATEPATEKEASK